MPTPRGAAEHIGADRDAGRRRAQARREFAPCDAVRFVSVVATVTPWFPRKDATATLAPSLPAGPSMPSAIGTASLGTRVGDALGFAASMIGWPMWLLALIGTWRLWAEEGTRSRGACHPGLECRRAWRSSAWPSCGWMPRSSDMPRNFSVVSCSRLVRRPCCWLRAAPAGASDTGTVTRIASAIFLCCCAILAGHSWTTWFY